MLPLAIPFPSIDPVLIHLGPLAIRWYALSYIAGLVLGWLYGKRLIATPRLWSVQPGSPALFDDLIVWVTFGVIIGGRLGNVLIYDPSFYFAHPLEILMIWHGGMAFHGGLLGAAIAIIAFALRRHVPVLSYLDIASAVAPIGLFFGRIANFVNAEVWGRVTDVPWAVVFCNERIMEANQGFCPAGTDPRHPSQLYEAALEGLLLFIILTVLSRSGGLKRPGLVSGVFGIGYAVARSVSELFREPDGYVGPITTGQALSLPLVIIGAGLIWYALRKKAPQPA